MNRLLVYVHFNPYDRLSDHVVYQLTQIRPLFSKLVVISNSHLGESDQLRLQEAGLMDAFIQRQNSGFDFAAWRDGLKAIGYDQLADYDSVTLMNDTCFGPLWDLTPIYEGFDADVSVDFWGMTNNRQTPDFPEHLQSYFMVFKRVVSSSAIFQNFWETIQDFTDVQEVIGQYETQVTTTFLSAGFRYKAVFDTTQADVSGMLHPDFSYYNPTAILQAGVPFLKVKTLAANTGIAPYILQYLKRTSSYPVSLIVQHLSDVTLPDLPYLLGQKYLPELNKDRISGSVAVHLHVFYTDLLPDFLTAFSAWDFAYDLYITTDTNQKADEIKGILLEYGCAAQVFVTGNLGRDIIPMLKLKEHLQGYDYVGHFHTKKSKEADFWAGESWRTELIDMLVIPAQHCLANLESRPQLGLVIADIPSFFRYNKIVDAWNEHLIAPLMNDLWEKMGLKKSINFLSMSSFVMSYGTFVWFKYDALKPLFDLDLVELDIPQEPLPQNSILHAMERLLVYVAWDRHYDFAIAPHQQHLTPFVDNKMLNVMGNNFVNFDAKGGIKGALAYIVIGPARALKYIVRRSAQHLVKRFKKTTG